MTKINTEYFAPKPSSRALCGLKIGDFFRVPGMNRIYRYAGYCDANSAYVLSLEDLSLTLKASITEVELVKVNEITIKVETDE